MRSNKYAAAITEIDSCKGSELESFIICIVEVVIVD